MMPAKSTARPYMMMEYCEGINLSQLVKKEGALPLHLACDYIRQAAVGLQHAAEQGVVHRDLKPSNLLLTRATATQPAVVKILDFGLARLTTVSGPGRLTLAGNLLGTIDYVAPEQIENAQDADVRSDIYSLGCTLYFLLTGRPPYSGANMMEKVSGRLMGQIPDVREARPEVPPALDALLRRMMAHKPAVRFQTAAELVEALVPFSYPTAVPVAPSKSPAASVPVVALPTQPAAKPQAKPESAPKPKPAPGVAAIPAAGLSKSTLLYLGAGLLGLVLLMALIAAISH